MDLILWLRQRLIPIVHSSEPDAAYTCIPCAVNVTDRMIAHVNRFRWKYAQLRQCQFENACVWFPQPDRLRDKNCVKVGSNTDGINCRVLHTGLAIGDHADFASASSQLL